MVPLWGSGPGMTEALVGEAGRMGAGRGALRAVGPDARWRKKRPGGAEGSWRGGSWGRPERARGAGLRAGRSGSQQPLGRRSRAPSRGPLPRDPVGR